MAPSEQSRKAATHVLDRPSASGRALPAPPAPELPAASPFNGSPAILADLMFVALLGPRGGQVSLDADGESAVLALRRGNATTELLTIEGDVAAAAIGRIARMTGLDPLAERGSLTETRAARLRVRHGADEAEILVTFGATSLGMSVELRLLSFHGRPVESRPLALLKRCATCGAYQPPLRQRCDVDGGVLHDLWDDPSPGGTIGVYRLRSLLGAGGMGEVFAADHALIERRVAIKVLRARLATDPTLESRFLFEARATSRLRHPNVVEVTDYGVLQSGSPYIVMERLEGESLERRLARGRALEPKAALRIAHAVALGLNAAHDGGVIHNDLKPSNVILLEGSTDEAPRLKVIDFGAASLAGAQDDGMLVGTPAYVAPERACGEASDVRSDTYSLGVLLFRMLSGKLPFEAQDSLAMLSAHASETPEPVTSPSGVLPSRVVHLVARALAKSPNERFQNMKEMIADIDHALRSFEGLGWRRWLP